MLEIIYLITQDGDTTRADQVPNYARVPFLEMAKKVDLVHSLISSKLFTQLINRITLN